MGLRGNHDNPGRGWAAQDVLEELDEVEVAQVVHLEGGLQAIFREAPGESEHSCIAHKHVKWPERKHPTLYRQKRSKTKEDPCSPRNNQFFTIFRTTDSWKWDALEGRIWDHSAQEGLGF